jgi:hypothetical protein
MATLVPDFAGMSIRDVVIPLLVAWIVSLCFSLISFFINFQSRTNLQKLRPKYVEYLRGKPEEEIPDIDTIRSELAQVVRRCEIRTRRAVLLEHLYNICLLEASVKPETTRSLLRDLSSLDYPYKADLIHFEERAKIVQKREDEFFRLLQKCMQLPDLRGEPLGRFLKAKILTEFERDEISRLLDSLKYYTLTKKIAIGILTVILTFLFLF